jgi:hypothetical protein
MPTQVISFAVLRRRDPVSMRSKLMEFGGPAMGIARHTLSPSE